MQAILQESEVFEDDEKSDLQRRCLLQQINEVSFAVNDILLYLDTHPDDEKALAFFEDVSDRRNPAAGRVCEGLRPTDRRHRIQNLRNFMEMVPAAIPVGKGRSVIFYVEL